MVCRAKGYPAPTLTWRREDHQPVAAGNWQANNLQDTSFTEDEKSMKNNTVHYGETLTIHKVSRLHMGAYLCIASNGVPPSVSRRIMLQVNFPPMIWIPNQLVGAPVGGKVTVDCHTEAYPKSINYWTKEEGEMIIQSTKYDVVHKVNTYKVHMILTIRNLVHEDFGTYRCYAKNSLGSTEGSIRLYEIHVPQLFKEPSTAKIQSLDGTSEEDDADIDIEVLAGSAVRSKGANGKYEVSDDKQVKETDFKSSNSSSGESSGSDGCTHMFPEFFSVVLLFSSIVNSWLLLPGT